MYECQCYLKADIVPIIPILKYHSWPSKDQDTAELKISPRCPGHSLRQEAMPSGGHAMGRTGQRLGQSCAN